MVNRPLNAPCWVVYTTPREAAAPGWAGTRFYLRRPSALDPIRNGTQGPTEYDGCFSATLVEPFLNLVDAVAAAILIDGCVDEYEAGCSWPVSMRFREDRVSQAKDDGSSGGRKYVDE